MKKNKSITVITAFFFPEDTAIGLYTSQFSSYLAEKGFTVKIITGFPNYPQWKIFESYKNLPSFYSETVNGIEIIRFKQFIPTKINFRARVLMMLSLFFGTFLNLRKIKNSDLVICIVPFTISILPALVLSKLKKAKLWIHIQDFEFDLALDSGIINNYNPLFRILKKGIYSFEKTMLNSAAVVSSISFSMLEKIKEKSEHKNPYFFPNWVSSEKINPNTYTQHPFLNKIKYSLLYSGNIGEKQDWLICEALCELIKVSDEIEIVIVGDGAYAKNLKKNLQKFNFVKFYPPVPFEELSNLLCSANAHFLFQKQEVIDTIMPSKILGMMASARPSLISGNANSEVSKIMSQSNGGYFFTENNAAEIYSCILTLKNTQNTDSMGQSAREFATTTFSEQQILNDFYTKIKTLI